MPGDISRANRLGRREKSYSPLGPYSSYRCSNLYPVLRDIPNSRHRSVIRSPAFSRTTNSIRSFTAVTSFQGMDHPPNPKSVTYVSGNLCYLSIRTAPGGLANSITHRTTSHLTFDNRHVSIFNSP